MTIESHGAATAQFLQRWRQGTLPSAWLLQGTQGIGKATWAMQAAVFLLTHYGAPTLADEPGLFGMSTPAPSPMFPVPADSPHARYAAQDAHPDLHRLVRPVDAKTGRRKQDIPAEMIRDARDFLSKTPAQAQCKIIILDSVDETNAAGANALLKNIEEPRPHTFFFLINHTPSRLLPTLRSRCCRLPMAPLSYHSFEAILSSRGVAAEEIDLPLLYRLCHGAVGKALQLLDSDTDKAVTALFLNVLTGIDSLSLHDILSAVSRFLSHSQPNLLMSLLLAWMQQCLKQQALAGRAPWSLDAALQKTLELQAASRLNLDADVVWLDCLTRWQRAVTSSA